MFKIQSVLKIFKIKGLIVKLLMGVSILILSVVTVSSVVNLNMIKKNLNQRKNELLDQEDKKLKDNLNEEKARLEHKILQTLNILSFTLVDAVYDFVQERTVNIMNPFLDEDIRVLYVLNDSDELFAGVFINASGKIETLEQKRDWPTELIIKSIPLKKNDENIGKVVVHYSVNALMNLEKNKMQEIERLKANTVNEIQQSISNNIMAQCTQGIILFIILVFCISLFMIKVIILPINHFKQKVKMLATGNLNVSFSYPYEDEIGELSRSFEDMRQILKDKITQMILMASSDLSQASQNITDASGIIVKKSQEMKAYTVDVFQSMEDITEKIMLVSIEIKQVSNNTTLLNHTLKKLTDTTGNLDSSSTHITQNLKSIIHHIQFISENIQKSSNTMEKIATDLFEISSNTKTALRISDEANGKESYTVTLMDHLFNKADNISTFLKSMNDITYTTKILALNASIEATRAGEAGNRFAVIANEVRKLSQDSSIFHKEISHELDEIRSLISGAQTSCHEVSDMLDTLLQNNTQIADLVEHETVQSKELSDYVKEVSLSSQEAVVNTNASQTELNNLNQSMSLFYGEIKLSSENLNNTDAGLKSIATSNEAIESISKSVNYMMKNMQVLINEMEIYSLETKNVSNQVGAVVQKLQECISFFNPLSY
ncbi:MAG: methyl-accepting chemotaxis protein [Desulfobacterales bacterium]|nr:methyl-accepting chemotaxis protein [Desulfobacterales bacterium]